MTHTITARRLITDIGSIEFPVLTIADDGTIADISSDPTHNDHTTLTAAFLDIHTHGAMGHDVMTASPAALSELQRFLAAHGVAHYLPTTVTASIDATLHALESLANAIERTASDNEAQPIGIHLEGPFLSHAKRGVHPPTELQPPTIDLFNRFQSAARGHIRLLTIAPEPNAATDPALKGMGFSPYVDSLKEQRASAPEGMSGTAIDLIRHATTQGVRVSLGHSNATAAETLAAIVAGATSATHTFNAMRPLDHREPGILGTVLDTASLYAELICDGIHVAPALVRLWLKAKGLDHAILITDAMSAAGMPDGDYALAGLPVTVAHGKAVLAAHPETLAGSVLTMDTAVANLQHFTHTPLADATRLASHNPATMLGRPKLTRLAPGSPANLNRFNEQGHLIATYIRGHQV
jgi:N-acetylglucosamine-6-phosphate deacetylase